MCSGIRGIRHLGTFRGGSGALHPRYRNLNSDTSMLDDVHAVPSQIRFFPPQSQIFVHDTAVPNFHQQASKVEQ